MKYLNRTLLPFAVLVFAAAAVLVLLLVFGVSTTRDIDVSGWDLAVAQLARWLLFVLGMHMTHRLLVVVIAHGRTRSEFMAQAAAFTVLLSGASALLAAAGYLLEHLLYTAMGWRQTMSTQPHFDSGAEFSRIFLAYWAVFAVWTAVGMLVGIGFDRTPVAGAASLLLGLGLVAPTITAIGGSGRLPLLRDIPFPVFDSLPLAVALCAGCWALGLLLTWALVRDTPVGARAAA
ncbi:hypothetical protein [Umezawaea sp. Da 62-37]|uniref:hypothetical protein n=1 Tax=Umezawaea sp. Da 62-37 TaxID=3075927 RepID=UPI0028F6FFE2|nr:hypothetical protein [Umezawaea sp. Da 62-37]WNV82021.1 hypothetical protein RM788_27815 [Umezawaea sp. Da 62-37]